MTKMKKKNKQTNTETNKVLFWFKIKSAVSICNLLQNSGHVH